MSLERPWGALPPSADQYRWAAEDPAKRSADAAGTLSRAG
jgi:hypothetical protein